MGVVGWVKRLWGRRGGGGGVVVVMKEVQPALGGVGQCEAFCQQGGE